MTDKKKFIDFIVDSGALTFGNFITKSGRKSPYFFNSGSFKKGSQLAALGRYYSGCIVDNTSKGLIPPDIQALFGPAYKGIPLSAATAVSMAEHHGIDLGYCFNRKEVKDHGEGGGIVGHTLKDGDKLLIIEDVITAGTAVKESIALLKQNAKVEICGLIIAVDRMEKGNRGMSATQEIYEEFGIPAFSIITIGEILDIMLTQKAEFSADNMDNTIIKVKEYMEEYCVCDGVRQTIRGKE